MNLPLLAQFLVDWASFFMLYGVSPLECRGGISYPPLCPFDDLQDAAFGKSILRILG